MREQNALFLETGHRTDVVRFEVVSDPAQALDPTLHKHAENHSSPSTLTERKSSSIMKENPLEIN